MSLDEVSVNSWAGMSRAEEAEAMAEAMVGLSDTFELLMGEAIDKAGWMLRPGFYTFERENAPDIETLQNNGIELANGIQGGISRVVETDYEADETYQGAWTDIPDVNF
ncbi:hypothetical protein [Nocardiopsis ganjiahuensis]|uniref:hypothetical protein n=1 Tax=Nocardiopsis ganjiahuensis TaxID=239984 RepID=UPI001EF9FE9A|nr:hypothetical protein [Nocardiopsis ganjiahuensis]